MLHIFHANGQDESVSFLKQKSLLSMTSGSFLITLKSPAVDWKIKVKKCLNYRIPERTSKKAHSLSVPPSPPLPTFMPIEGADPLDAVNKAQ